MIWTLPKLYMLTALRYAEQHPDHGKGHAASIGSSQTAIARSLARHGLTKMGRTTKPKASTTVALTDKGREVVDGILARLVEGT